jgi:uncharacterized protein
MKAMFFLFGGKAYTIFSLMFGFSFFIQMDRAQNKGVDFSWRFLWRLLLLVCIGYLLSLMYCGQILIIYAVMGIPLIFLYRVNSKILIVIAVLFLLQIPTIINIISSYTNPDFEYQRTFGRGLYGEAFRTFANGSFKDVVRFNSWKAHIAVWSWTYYNGRYLQLFGLFILGLVLGKKRFFEHFGKYKKKMIVVFIVSLVLFVSLHILLLIVQKLEIPRPRHGFYTMLIKSYSDLALSSTYISLIIILFQRIKSLNNSSILARYGRMSLTNYIMQPLIGIPLFYGYGFALYHYFGPTLSLFYGIVFLLLQLWFSRIWLKNFHYGPFEWLWRAFTFFDFNLKFKTDMALKKVKKIYNTVK